MQINKPTLNRFEKVQMPTRIVNNQKNLVRLKPQNQIAFKGIGANTYNKITEGLAKGLGKLVDTKFTKSAVKFLSGKSENKVARAIGNFINVKDKWFQHAIAAESIYLTSFYMYNTKKSKAIPEEQKRPMMINQALVTTLCTALGYTIDSKISKVFNKAKHIFTVANVTKIAEGMKNEVATAKAAAKTAGDVSAAIKMPLKHASGIANGISKLKSVLVFGFIYRYLAPVFITPIANRVSEFLDKKETVPAEKSENKLKKGLPISVNFASVK